MKRQHLTIRIIDRRQEPPDQREKSFSKHQDYLQAMGQLMNMHRVHLDEDTTSVVTIYPENQGNLFEQDAE